MLRVSGRAGRADAEWSAAEWSTRRLQNSQDGRLAACPFPLSGKFIFSTYGANPVSAAAACAVLDVVAEEGVQARAAQLGEVVSRRLHAIADAFEGCLEVRGSGLMWGIELCPSIASQVFEAMKDQHFLVRSRAGAGGQQAGGQSVGRAGAMRRALTSMLALASQD